MASNPRHVERESTDIGQEARKATDQAAQTSRTMADAAERTARAGTEVFQRNAARGSETWQSGTETASRIAQRSLEQLAKILGVSGETARETVEQNSGNMQAVMESGSIIAGGLQDVAAEWFRFVQARTEKNLDHIDQLRECRSLQAYMALQTQMVRDNLEALLQSTHRVSERTTQFAGTAMRRMSDTPVAPH